MSREPDHRFFDIDRPPWRPNWPACAWWAVYVTGFAAAAYGAKDRGEIVVYVIGAALIVPGLRLLGAIFAGPETHVSATAAQRLRQHLLTRPARSSERAMRERQAPKA